MTRIGLLSDTHSYLDPKIFQHFKNCDEIWHAGDIGNLIVLNELEAFKKVRAVWGNIDGHSIRNSCTKHNRFKLEGKDIWITHIGGYPGRYDRAIYHDLIKNPPDVFISGHSHILKVQYDKKLNLLHLNPGACGKLGFHKVKTLLRFTIDSGKIENMEAIELGPRVSKV